MCWAVAKEFLDYIGNTLCDFFVPAGEVVLEVFVGVLGVMLPSGNVVVIFTVDVHLSI
jgi:hypothetical protein